MTPTRGFCGRNEPGVVVCLLPGTELAFEWPVCYSGLWDYVVNYVKARKSNNMADAGLARFRQVGLGNPHIHHDAIELADGRIIKLALLHEGQRARVLQLPAQNQHVHHHKHAGNPAVRQPGELTPAR